MAIDNNPLWPFEPNWSASVTETLEWLTDILTSPTGSEQRRSLRYFPRRSFEFTIAAYGEERMLFDNLVTRFGSHRWYVPIWHDVNVVDGSASAGSNYIPCSSAATSEFQNGDVVCLMGDSPFDAILMEVQGVTSAGVSLTANLEKTWPIGTRVFSTIIARLTDQPETSKQSDNLVTAQIRFQSVQAHQDDGSNSPVPNLVDGFSNYYVLRSPPDDKTSLSAGVERMLVELDNSFSMPIWQDTADRPFTYQQYNWVLEGRAQLQQFRYFLQLLRGRAMPIWMPTFMSDFELKVAVSSGDDTLSVSAAGFTSSGGPRPDRSDIMIQTISANYYRHIQSSAMDGNGDEVLLLDATLPAIGLDEIVQISFMTIVRLNQDAIDIVHQTDSDGISTASMTFRSAPNTRDPAVAAFI